MRRPIAVIAVAAASLTGFAACSSSSPTSSGSSSTTSGSSGTTVATPPIVVGSANFPENVVLADIYADALKKAGVSVTVKPNIGSREIYFAEMKNGALNVFPEYNGALLDYLNKSATASSTTDVDTALAAVLPSSLEALNPAAAQDSDSVTVTAAFAAAHNLKSIGDLKAIESQITFGAAAEFQTRLEGLVGLKSVYGLTFKAFDPLDEAGPITIAALNQGTVQAADIYTTDPSVAKYHFVALADPLHLFAAQNVIPIINKSVATPVVTQTLNAISAALTTSDLVTLVAAVVNDHDDPDTVAQQYVSQMNLG